MPFCKKHNTDYDINCPICDLIAKAGSWEHVWNQHSDEPQQQEIMVRASILSYETGQVLRLATKVHLNPADKALYEADMKTELSDVICQCRLLCQFMGWNFEDVSDLGKIRIRKHTMAMMFDKAPVETHRR